MNADNDELNSKAVFRPTEDDLPITYTLPGRLTPRRHMSEEHRKKISASIRRLWERRKAEAAKRR